MMHISTHSVTGVSPSPRIPWTELAEEGDVAEQIWGALPKGDVTRKQIEEFLRVHGLVPAVIEPDTVYSYADGPRFPGSPVQAEWLIEFHLANGLMNELLVDKRLLGP